MYLICDICSLPHIIARVNGHGTHVAGTSLQRQQYRCGRCAQTKIWAMKVIPDNGIGDESDLLEGLHYVAANAREIEVVQFESYENRFPGQKQ